MLSQRRRRTTLALLLVLGCGWWGLPPLHNLRLLVVQQQGDIRGDHDNLYFVQAWDKAPHLRDTWRWWIGPWGQKHRPFYRPLSSLLFWLEYQAFGLHGLYQFTLVLFLCHLATLLLAWRFLNDLLGELSGTLAACLWAVHAAGFYILSIALYALDNWKDNVESWHALAYVGCLWSFLRFLRSGQGDGQRRWWFGALALFLVALCIKEMAYTAPLLLLLLAWHEKQLSRQGRAVLPFFGIAGAMFIFRWWALGGWGYRIGANRQWLFRFLSDLGGAPITPILHGNLLCGAMLCAGAALWLLLRRQWTEAGVCAGAALLALLLTSYLTETGLADTASRLLLLNEWQPLPFLASLLFFWWRFFIQRRPDQIFGLAWVIITYLPLLSGPNTGHVFYLVSLGWAIWLAGGLIDLWALGARLPAQLRHGIWRSQAHASV
ncbi:MAG: hypothetical protein M3347_00480 [Armatimonadota bacterium]|nr:hypothetical protein [Armatimonadota bacterium]